TRGVEARGKLVGDRLLVDEAVYTGGADGRFVKLLGIERAIFDARDLSSDERGASLEVLRAVLGPLPDLAMLGVPCLPMPVTLRGGSRMAERSSDQRGVEFIVCLLKDCRRRRPKLVCVRGRRGGGNVGTREEARLQLPEPVQEGDGREARVFGQLLLEAALVEPGIVEGAELRSE